MEEFKSLTQSRTFWGAVVALAAGILGLTHYSINATDQANLVELLSGIATAVGSLVAIYGRVVASKKIGAIVLLLLAGLTLAPSSGRAQTVAPRSSASRVVKVPPAAPGPANPLDGLWDKIKSASVADLQYAKALADGAASPGGKLRSGCYAAWIQTIGQAQGAGLKDQSGNPLTQPSPHVFSSFEALAEVADNLQPTSPFIAACAPAWTALKLTATQFITMAVTGVVSLGTLGVTIP